MGSLHLVMGCMFSGKSTEALRLGERYKTIGKRVLYINSHKDTRSHSSYGHLNGIPLGTITTHNGKSLQCVKCENLNEISHILNDYDVFVIDEVQFFNDVSYIIEMVNSHHKMVIVSGLDGDYKQQKFGHIFDLIPHCDTMTKLHALCKLCGDGTHALFSKRIVNSESQECIGGSEEYIVVCRKHLA